MKAGLPLAYHHDLTPSFFEQQWRIYRKFVDNNYFYHREVYGQLHRILVDEVDRPFRFLDIACGDASATVDALKGTGVALLESIPRDDLAGLRDRALISTMLFSFARISAVLSLKRQDFYYQGPRRWLRL